MPSRSLRQMRKDRRLRAAIAPLVEQLEARQLLSAAAIDISFQPASSPVPDGLLADNGAQIVAQCSAIGLLRAADAGGR